MMGWTNLAPDLKLDVRLSIFRRAVTGRLAWAELWTFEPEHHGELAETTRSAPRSASTPELISTPKMRTPTTPVAPHYTLT
jgi:hypothetical protein